MGTQTINITPTWAQIAPTFALILTDGTWEGQQIIMPELHRMAALADERNIMAREKAAMADDVAMELPRPVLDLSGESLAYFAQAIIGGQNVRDAWEDATNALPLPPSLARFTSEYAA